EAFTRLAEASGEARWIAEATAAADGMLDLFWDGDAGVFTTSGSDAERLIAQPVDTVDGAVPSSNSVAAGALLRLAALTGVSAYEQTARKVIDALAPALGKAPSGFANMVAAADLARRGLTELTIAGSDLAMLAVAHGSYRPDVVLAWGEPYPSPMWDGRTGTDYAGVAFVCRDQTCGPPLRSAEALAAALSALPRQ
ncbi:MAG: thioredoxin domain-containing protein, partial [Acidimicrobiales bacterium]